MRSALTAFFILFLHAGTALAAELPRLAEFGGADPSQPRQPVAVVVHGINPLAGDLDPLAQDLAQRGYRTFLFHYKDKQDLDKSSSQLEAALRPLARNAKSMVIVAHSMGGLISRRALTEGRPGGLPEQTLPIKLITIASSFGGFKSANWARLDLGLGPGAFDDLGTRARFIRKPGKLRSNVVHVKIETDEEGKTLKRGSKRQKDTVVKLKQQRQATVDAAAKAIHLVDTGHVGSVRDDARQVSAAVQKILSAELGPRHKRKTKSSGITKQLKKSTDEKPTPRPSKTAKPKANWRHASD